MNTLTILIDVSEQQNELATDFLNEAQKSSGKNENDFWKALCSGWQYLSDKLNGKAVGQTNNSFYNYLIVAEQLGLVFYLATKKNNQLYTKDGLTKEGLRITFNHLAKYALEHRLIWYYYSYKGVSFEISYEASPLKIYENYKVLSEQDFKRELKKKQPEQIAEFLNIHLKKFVRDGGEKSDWVRHTKQFINLLSIEQQDSFYNWLDLNSKDLPSQLNSSNLKDGNLTDLRLIINEFLEPHQDIFRNEKDFKKAILEIENFFSGTSNIKAPIFVKNGNVKNLAYALGQIWRSFNNDVITYEYLMFYKTAFSIFSSQKIDSKNIFGCTLYKYSLSKT